MRSSILREMEKMKGVTHAFILTHDVDFFFIQGLLLKALRAAGSPLLTIFADCGRAASSFQSQGSLASGLGQRYRLVPVALSSGGRFHPKAVLLCGKEGATLYVGSGNLTFGGWCDNGEVWSRFRTQDGEGAAVTAFREYLDELLGLVPLQAAVRFEIEAAFDATSRPWAAELPEADHLVGRLGSGPSLLDRIGPRLRGSRLTVCTPFFDPEGEALLRVAETVGATEVEVLIQESSTNLMPEALASWPVHVRARPADFVHVDAKGEHRKARLHAKWFIASDGARATAILGSANCSRAALTAAGITGNAELVVVREGETRDLVDQIRAEIAVEDRPLALPAQPAEPEEDEAPPVENPVILVARYDLGILHIALAPRGGFVPTTVVVDGEALAVTPARPEALQVRHDIPPSRVRVDGLLGGECWSTPEHWVDVESLLRGSAGRRRMVDLVRQSQQAGHLSVQVWADLVDAAFEEIASPTPWGGGGGDWSSAERPTEWVWKTEDVFLDSYALPAARPGQQSGSESDVVSATLALLLHFSMGEEGVDHQAADDDDDGDDLDPSLVDADEDEDEADRPAPPPPPPPAKAAKHQQRALAVLEKMLGALADPEFLAKRHPGDIRRAIIMLALLLRVGRQQGWLERGPFFALTQRAWKAVFFSGSRSGHRGDLAERLDTEDDPVAFQQALATPRLAAALAAWGLAAHLQGDGPDLIRFDLTAAVSAAHHPWMWRGAPLERIAHELHQLIRYTEQSGEFEAVQDWWLRVQRRGAALRALEAELERHPTAALRARLGAWHAPPGTMLWQGSSGWCVTEGAAVSTRPRDKIAVRKLQGDEGEKHFVASFLVPLDPLLTFLAGSLSGEVVAELRTLSGEVSRAYDTASRSF
jgi:hypothetical protein